MRSSRNWYLAAALVITFVGGYNLGVGNWSGVVFNIVLAGSNLFLYWAHEVEGRMSDLIDVSALAREAAEVVTGVGPNRVEQAQRQIATVITPAFDSLRAALDAANGRADDERREVERLRQSWVTVRDAEVLRAALAEQKERNDRLQKGLSDRVVLVRKLTAAEQERDRAYEQRNEWQHEWNNAKAENRNLREALEQRARWMHQQDIRAPYHDRHAFDFETCNSLLCIHANRDLALTPPAPPVASEEKP